MEITRSRSQLLTALEQATVHLRQAQNRLVRLKSSLANKSKSLQGALHAVGFDLTSWLKSFLGEMAFANSKITKFTSQLCVAFRQEHFRRVKNTFTTTLAAVRSSVAEKPRRLQEARRARESDLPKLLESSLDAIVVTNANLRFVAANPKALELFGISEKNMTMFSMDAFLPRGQILSADEKTTPLIGRKEWHGECRIRLLDGNLRVAEFIFVVNYVPFLYLCMFRNDRKWHGTKRLAA